MPTTARLTPLRCELCGGPMRLVRRLTAPDASPMAVYQCEKCHHSVTRPAETAE